MKLRFFNKQVGSHLCSNERFRWLRPRLPPWLRPRLPPWLRPQCYSETLSLFFEICSVNNNNKYENFNANFNEDNNNNNNKDESFFANASTLACVPQWFGLWKSELPTLFIYLPRLFAKASDFRLALRKGVRFSKMF